MRFHYARSASEKETRIMLTNEVKPLHPLTYGNVLIVGVKSSNFDEEIRTHPRVVLWDNQNAHWDTKDLPTNVRAVFMTRFISHKTSTKLLREARRRQITIFNPEGTGMIAKQVRELLAITKTESELTEEVIEPKTEPEVEVTEVNHANQKGVSKLDVLFKFIDSSKNIADNSRLLYAKAKEMGVETTIGSLAQVIRIARRDGRINTIVSRRGGHHPVSKREPRRAHKYVDVSVEILDNMIKELRDMRDFLVATTEENKSLKLRIEKFKKVLNND